MARCIVTGSEGFVGHHLVDYLEHEEFDIFGFDLKAGNDIRDYEQVRQAIDFFRPDYIFHLGALTYVPESFIDPRRSFEINTMGSLNILEAVRVSGLKTKIHLAGTSEEYGDTEEAPSPTTEETICNPLSPYAIAKLAMDYLGRLYARSYNMHVVVTRAFNHTGPGRGEMFAESAFAKQIAEIELGHRGILEHGNLESIRNYTDVRDIVRAYRHAVDLQPGVYNICSNQNISMKELLDVLVNLSSAEITTQTASSLYRPSDFSFKKPSCEKFKRLTGWSPQIPLGQTLHDVLEYWRKELV